MRRCVRCGFVFAADRRIPPGLYDEAYTEQGEYGDLLTGAQALRDERGHFDWMHQWAVDHAKLTGARRALDVGCGVGSALHLAKQAGWEPHGHDVSGNALRVAHEVFGVTTHPEPIDEMAARGERFDLVTAFNVVEHVPDPIAYLRTLRRLTADGGHFGIAVPNYDSYAMRHTDDPQWLPPFHLNFFNLSTLKQALAAAGFTLRAHKVKFASWSGIPGPKWKRYLFSPYLIANGLIGRLGGNGIVAVATAS